jgi:hypothetical protein
MLPITLVFLTLHTRAARNDLIEAEKLTEKELQILREHTPRS